MPLDPILSLAVSMQASPGTYAVLLGSGVSAAAGIPSGFQVTKLLTERLAGAAKVDAAERHDLATWFRERTGEEPTYPAVLAAVANEPTERQRILREFFEPTEEEREANMKMPTAAHRAIAELVRLGYVRVILTTNFDRLMEQALTDVGIAPTVISTAPQVMGMEPVGRQDCLLIKLHGDYLDPMIKNTPEELEVYDPAFDKLLDRVLDDYGLIVSGWSAESDVALRCAMERAPNRRYTTYWGVRGELGEAAKGLVERRKAQTIATEGADVLFVTLREKVQAVADLRAAPPLGADAAVATLKRYLPDPVHRIRLHDLVVDEADRVARWIEDDHLARRNEPWDDPQKSLDQIARYEAQTEVLRAMLAAGLYHDNGTYADLFSLALRRIAQAADPLPGSRTMLSRYPALLLLYAGGLVALASKRYESLARLVHDTRLWVDGADRNILVFLKPSYVLAEEVARHVSGLEMLPTATSQYLERILRPEMRPYIPDQFDYTQTFDMLEYLLSALRLYVGDRDGVGAGAERGAFAWRYRREPHHASQRLAKEATRVDSWLVTSGLFPAIDAFNRAKQEVDQLPEREPR